jgi:aminopeptidase N
VKRRASTLLAAVALAATASKMAADTYPRQHAVDAIHYRFAVVVSEHSPDIEGETTATFRIVAPVDAIELDLVGASPAMRPGAPRGVGMVVQTVTRAGQPVAFTHRDHRLRLPVTAEARPGDDVTYTIRYRGTPADGLQARTNMHGERVMFSEGWPNRARHWLPTIDHPYDKATGEMIVTAPSKWQVVSNGLLVEEVDLDGDRRRTHWKQSVPIATWLYAVGLARFDAHHAGFVRQVPLQSWAFPQDRASARALFEDTTRRAMEFFSDRIGPYPYEKLANVQASGFGGGMENATVIFYGEKGVAGGRGPVVHEVAHQWFGNSITERDWDDVWLSEGFATYFAHLYREQFDGRTAFVDGLQRSRESVLEAAQQLPDTPVVHGNLADMSRVLNTFVYEKGGWVLHMLRAEVGDDVFWHGIREYYRRYRDRNASTDDFRQVMEQASGRDLGWFFAQWLTRGGNPAVHATWRYEASKKAVDVTLQQSHAGAPYRLTLEVEVVSPSGTQRHRVAVDQGRQTITLPADREPSRVVLDPETWLLADITTGAPR